MENLNNAELVANVIGYALCFIAIVFITWTLINFKRNMDKLTKTKKENG